MPANRVRPVRLRVLGQLVPPMSTVGTIGPVLGHSRTNSYEVARRDEWPMDGGRVIVPALLDRLGIAYEIAEEAGDE